MRRMMRFLRREMAPRLQKHLSSPADGLYLLTDGKSTHLESAPQRIIDLLKNARQAMWLISVSDQVQRAGKRERFHRSDGQLKLF